jgi:hypothetical protein
MTMVAFHRGSWEQPGMASRKPYRDRSARPKGERAGSGPGCYFR